MTSFVEYDLINYVLNSQDVLKCIFVNDFWHVEKGVEDSPLRGKSLISCLMISLCSSMNWRCCERVKIGNVGMPSSQRSSSSKEFVEVRLGMKCDVISCLFRVGVCSTLSALRCIVDESDWAQAACFVMDVTCKPHVPPSFFCLLVFGLVLPWWCWWWSGLDSVVEIVFPCSP